MTYEESRLQHLPVLIDGLIRACDVIGEYELERDALEPIVNILSVIPTDQGDSLRGKDQLETLTLEGLEDLETDFAHECGVEDKEEELMQEEFDDEMDNSVYRGFEEIYALNYHAIH